MSELLHYTEVLHFETCLFKQKVPVTLEANNLTWDVLQPILIKTHHCLKRRLGFFHWTPALELESWRSSVLLGPIDIANFVAHTFTVMFLFFFLQITSPQTPSD